MSISDLSKAQKCLEKIGYYRFSGYWYPFREVSTITDPLTRQQTITVLDTFKNGTTFSVVHDLYVFDKKLRLLVLDAIERIEVGLRVEISLLLSSRDIWAHRNTNELDNKFSPDMSTNLSPSAHIKWLLNIDQQYTRSKEQFAKDFRGKYASPLPIWMAIELWDFGTLSHFTVGMRHRDLGVISNRYGVSRRDLFTSWISNLNYIRNVCAHHSRLWNRSLDAQAKPPRLGEVAELDHIVGTRGLYKVYYSLSVIRYILKVISPDSSWAERLKTHMSTIPNSNYIGIDQAGFPLNWESLPLWS